MTSGVGTSASIVIVMHRLPFCLAATIAVAVDRPSADDVEFQLDRTRTDHDRTGENRVDRTH